MPSLCLPAPTRIAIDSWIREQNREAPTTSNQPSYDTAFQRWFKFKEAFSPSFVKEMVERLPYRARTCLDPFGGSGTTALTCQFLGIHPSTVEVNPFLADLIEAKLSTYDPASVENSLSRVLRNARRKGPYWRGEFAGAPSTFVEPGLAGRWIFNRDIAGAILRLRSEIEHLPIESERRLLRVLLGSCLIGLSNIVVNGKGRRYRKNWRDRPINCSDVYAEFCDGVAEAITDVHLYRRRACSEFTLIRGDAREEIGSLPGFDFALFSPPYPNSFDYTDIYNVELWALGYLSNSDDNRRLREQTLRSHVQIKRDYADTFPMPAKLSKIHRKLREQRSELWNQNIPEMVLGYFADMRHILSAIKTRIRSGGHVIMAVGDSRYGGVFINVAAILAEIGNDLGYTVKSAEPVRSMRTSAQQGGRTILKESLITLVA